MKKKRKAEKGYVDKSLGIEVGSHVQELCRMQVTQ
jgi:hypothetical protein